MVVVCVVVDVAMVNYGFSRKSTKLLFERRFSFWRICTMREHPKDLNLCATWKVARRVPKGFEGQRALCAILSICSTRIHLVLSMLNLKESLQACFVGIDRWHGSTWWASFALLALLIQARVQWESLSKLVIHSVSALNQRCLRYVRLWDCETGQFW